MKIYDRKFLSELDRSGLRRALKLLRYQDRHPHESIPAAAQYDGLATPRSIMAEYRRRGWKVPQRTRTERS